MKRIISLIFVLSILIFAGCAESNIQSDTGMITNNSENDTGNSADKQTEKQEIKIPENIDSSSSAIITSPELPAVYETVVNDLRTIVEYRISENFESDHNNGIYPDVSRWLKDELENDDDIEWSNMLVEMPGYPAEMSMDSYGYILKDINGDGILELFFVRKDHTVLAVFTADEDEADLLDVFWSRYKCVITDKNEIYTLGSGGESHTDYSVKKLDFYDDDFTVIKSFGNDDGYYETVNGKRESIDEKRFDELIREYPFENAKSWTDNAVVTF